jgi:hypothetical protein
MTEKVEIERKTLYAGAVGAIRGPKTQFMPVCILSGNFDEAHEFAQVYLEEHFPEAGGWREQRICLMKVPEQMINEMNRQAGIIP